MRKTTDLDFLTIAEVSALLAKKKLSPVELVEAALARMEALNPRLNAFLTICAESAREEAKRAERELARGRRRGPLHGLPISTKDNIFTRGVRTTAGSKLMAEFVPAEDAAVVRRLRTAGAILLGKTNLNEFAYGVTGENPHYGATRNPWDTERMTGGSSAGSSAAVAAGMCFGSVGTDTGGSCRIPPALCGIVGLKPTYGRVSVEGVVPLSTTLDHVGPIARSVQDAALLLAVMGARSRREAAAFGQISEQLPGNPRGKFHGLRIGRPKEYYFDRIDPAVLAAVEAAILFFEKRGAQICAVELPGLSESEQAGNHIALPEATHFHRSTEWFPERAAEYSEDVRKRLELGLEVRAAEYLHALDVQRRCKRELDLALEEVDAIVAPTVPIPAPRIGEKTAHIGNAEETVRATLLRLCRPANLTGHPAISVPCGFTQGGLPIGLQIIGPEWQESKLLQIARTYEQAHDWHRMHPNL